MKRLSSVSDLAGKSQQFNSDSVDSTKLVPVLTSSQQKYNVWLCLPAVGWITAPTAMGEQTRGFYMNTLIVVDGENNRRARFLSYVALWSFIRRVCRSVLMCGSTRQCLQVLVRLIMLNDEAAH